jgi:hypothetical protein
MDISAKIWREQLVPTLVRRRHAEQKTYREVTRTLHPRRGAVTTGILRRWRRCRPTLPPPSSALVVCDALHPHVRSFEPPRTRRLHCAPSLTDMMPCVGRIAHCRIECTAGSFDILDDAVTQMDRHAPPSSRGCSCMAIEAMIAAGRRSQGLMMYAGRIALQIARAAALSTI